MEDCIEIVVPGRTFRLVASRNTVLCEGETFSASSVLVESLSNVEVVVTLPADHEFSVRFLAGGVPKGQTRVSWKRVDDEGRVVHRVAGEIFSASVDHREARFHVVSSFALAMKRPIGMVVSRTCQHLLFDAGCRLARSKFSTQAVIVELAGYELTLNVSLAPGWSVGGELVHVASSERSFVAAQRVGPVPSETVVTLQARSYNARKDDLVEVSAGCDRTIETCRDKFQNVVNFGGFPHLPSKNPFET